MVSIGIQRNSDGRLVGCHMSGHAGYDEHGFDIVCAAVSALSATVNVRTYPNCLAKGNIRIAKVNADMVLSGRLTRVDKDIL